MSVSDVDDGFSLWSMRIVLAYHRFVGFHRFADCLGYSENVLGKLDCQNAGFGFGDGP